MVNTFLDLGKCYLRNSGVTIGTNVLDGAGSSCSFIIAIVAQAITSSFFKLTVTQSNNGCALNIEFRKCERFWGYKRFVRVSLEIVQLATESLSPVLFINSVACKLSYKTRGN